MPRAKKTQTPAGIQSHVRENSENGHRAQQAMQQNVAVRQANTKAKPTPSMQMGDVEPKGKRDIAFKTRYETFFGQHLHHVSELDNWNIDESNRMSWAGNGYWWINKPLVTTKSFEYKYVVVNPDGSSVWETTPNRVYDRSRGVSVNDKWNNPDENPFDNWRNEGREFATSAKQSVNVH